MLLMDVQLKTEWLTALRSGEYKQGKHFLRDSEDNFCCMGVLCDIVDPNAWVEGGVTGRYGYSDEANRGYPPSEIANMLVDTAGGKIIMLLANMNDQGRKSFAEIADFLEGNLSDAS
jgi:hypothetical protein